MPSDREFVFGLEVVDLANDSVGSSDINLESEAWYRNRFGRRFVPVNLFWVL